MSYPRLLPAFVAFFLGIILIIPALFLILPLWFIPLLLKTVKSWKTRMSKLEDIIQFDQALGWRSKPNIKTWMELDGEYRVTTGEDGWRGNYSLKDCNTVVIGDSFVFGQGVSDKNHFASHTNSAKVKPLGSHGYGATQYLILLKNLGNEIKGKLVIWFIFTGNDYREAIRPTSYGRHSPFVFYDNTTKSYKIRPENINPRKLPFNFEKGYSTSMPELADLYYKNYFSDYAFGAFEYLAEEAKKHCEIHGATFAITTIPLWWVHDEKAVRKVKRYCSNEEKFSPSYPDQKSEEICKSYDISFCSGAHFYQRADFLPNDFHWSRLGNKTAAKIIDKLHISFLEKKKDKQKS